jgi:N-acetylmuramoyl-L-alanine amidase
VAGPETRSATRLAAAAFTLLAVAAAGVSAETETPPGTSPADVPGAIRVIRGESSTPVPAIRRDGRMLVPLGRALFAALGEEIAVSVVWPFATLALEDRTVRLAIGAAEAVEADGRLHWLPGPVRVVAGAAALHPESLPVALAALGLRCRWNPAGSSLELSPPPGEGVPASAGNPADAPASGRTAETPAPAGSRSAAGGLAGPLGRWPLHIVLDAGHGGHDCGAYGNTGLCEKAVTLDLVLRIARILRSRGAKVTLTRDSDTFVSLPTRVRIAAKANADLFVSVHVNSSLSRSARGVETYVYGARTTSRNAAEVARRENAEANYMDIILGDLAQQVHHDASIRVAGSVEKELVRRLSLVGRAHEKVMEAPFYVLARSGRPAVLVEVGFISNRNEEARLRDSGYLRSLAECIAAGLAGLAGGRS